MQIENYYELLNNIEKLMADMDSQALNEMLEQTFQIKPVRLKWYLLKAQALLKEGKAVSEIKDFLSDKCAPWYEYDEVEEYFYLLSALSEYEGDLSESHRYLYQLEKLKNQQEYSSEVLRELEALVDKVLIQSELQLKDVERLCELYYITGNIYLYLLWMVTANRIFEAEWDIRSWVLEKTNVGYYYERLLEQKQEVFAILVTPNHDEKNCLLAAKALRLLGKTSIIVEEFQSAEEQLAEITRQYATDELIMVMGSGLAIDELAMSSTIKPKLERLTEAQYDYMEENMAVGRYGNYLSYMARIYKTTRKELEDLLYYKPTCRFSIIIPCRNAGDTLHYTLKTCLEQSFQGEYEILVSDNSEAEWGAETPTLKMCQEFQDSRIRYIRTPRNLPLAKNFEFAYLHSRGEFLISMGADDGILPWALEELDTIIAENPEQPILLWEEAFYKWPDVDGRIMDATGKAVLQANCPYEKYSPNIYLYDCQKVFQKSFEEYGMLYVLPQVYHNSGIHREHMQSIYERYGVLWAGRQQDIFMAVVNANMQEKLCMVENLFTITGISNNSIGANYRVGNTAFQQMNLEKISKKTFGQGYRAYSYTERLCAGFRTEYDVLYTATLAAHALGIVPDEVIEQADRKNMFAKIIQRMSLRDIQFDSRWHYMRYIMSLHGEEMLEWFDENYYLQRLQPVLMEKDKEVGANNNYGEIVTIKRQKVQVEPHSIDDVYRVSLLLKEIYTT